MNNNNNNNNNINNNNINNNNNNVPNSYLTVEQCSQILNVVNLCECHKMSCEFTTSTDSKLDRNGLKKKINKIIHENQMPIDPIGVKTQCQLASNPKSKCNNLFCCKFSIYHPKDVKSFNVLKKSQVSASTLDNGLCAPTPAAPVHNSNSHESKNNKLNIVLNSARQYKETRVQDYLGQDKPKLGHNPKYYLPNHLLENIGNLGVKVSKTIEGGPSIVPVKQGNMFEKTIMDLAAAKRKESIEIDNQNSDDGDSETEKPTTTTTTTTTSTSNGSKRLKVGQSSEVCHCMVINYDEVQKITGEEKTIVRMVEDYILPHLGSNVSKHIGKLFLAKSRVNDGPSHEILSKITPPLSKWIDSIDPKSTK